MRRLLPAFLFIYSLCPNPCFGQAVASNAEPGRLEGTNAFLPEGSTPARPTKTHPAWFRGTGANGMADTNAKCFYHELIGPGLSPPAFQSNFIHSGPLQMKDGYTYPSHNHPASEIYYVVNGEAGWYVDEESQHLTAGSLIYDRALSAHGWTVAGDKPLKLVWIWWSEGDPSALHASAKMDNPDLACKQETA